MDVTIGIQHSARVITFDTQDTAAEISSKVTTAIADQTVLELTDSRGNTFLIPSATIAYVELGQESKRTIGFGVIPK